MKKELYNKIKELARISDAVGELERTVEAMITDGQKKTELAPGFAFYPPEIEAKRKETFEAFAAVQKQITELQDEMIAMFNRMDRD